MRTQHWCLVWCPDFPSYQHNLPCNDSGDHIPTVHCHCRPEKVLLVDGPHVLGVQFQHNAFDGRPY